MICHQCQNIVNLDTLLTATIRFTPHGITGRPHAHHQNYAAIVESARLGCTICGLICKSMKRRCWEGNEEQIYFILNDWDVLIFDTSSKNEEAVSFEDFDIMNFCAFRLRAIEDDPVTTLMPGVFANRLVAEDSSSDACFKLAKYWLDTCMKTHSSLCQVKHNLPLPTRVVDVGDLRSPLVTLHVSNGHHGQWVTLSHCWGKTRPATTTTRNLESRRAGILITTLPQTFQDAIMITRKLGYQFLWIDCLCIVQDSVLDWQKESAKMDVVYSNAVLNISADAATDMSQGIFKSSSEQSEQQDEVAPSWVRSVRRGLVPIEVQSPKNNIRSTLYVDEWHGDNFFWKEPLQERGWVLQEAALSRRRLRYTSCGISWSCTTVSSFCNETRPHEITNLHEQSQYIESLYQIPYQALSHRCELEHCQPNSDCGKLKHSGRAWQVLEWWYRQVNDYARRQLTFPHDRLPAFSGFAKAWCAATGYHFKAGILVEDFWRGLLWQTRGRGMQNDIAPSWSWAVVRAEGEHEPIYAYDVYQGRYVEDNRRVELVDLSVQNVGDNPFGRVSSGTLTLRGFCHELKDTLMTHDFYFANPLALAPFRFVDRDFKAYDGDNAPPQDAMCLYMDILDESDKGFWQHEDIQIMRIVTIWAERASPAAEEIYFLILQGMPGREVTYRRIGIARMPSNCMKDADWKVKKVTIL